MPSLWAFLMRKFIGGEFKMEGIPQRINKLKDSNNNILEGTNFKH